MVFITNEQKKEKPMKSMTCRQLGGACDKVFKANTFEEMGSLMQNPKDMEEWFESKKKEFESLPDED